MNHSHQQLQQHFMMQGGGENGGMHYDPVGAAMAPGHPPTSSNHQGDTPVRLRLPPVSSLGNQYHHFYTPSANPVFDHGGAPVQRSHYNNEMMLLAEAAGGLAPAPYPVQETVAPVEQPCPFILNYKRPTVPQQNPSRNIYDLGQRIGAEANQRHPDTVLASRTMVAESAAPAIHHQQQIQSNNLPSQAMGQIATGIVQHRQSFTGGLSSSPQQGHLQQSSVIRHTQEFRPAVIEPPIPPFTRRRGRGQGRGRSSSAENTAVKTSHPARLGAPARRQPNVNQQPPAPGQYNPPPSLADLGHPSFPSPSAISPQYQHQQPSFSSAASTNPPAFIIATCKGTPPVTIPRASITTSSNSSGGTIDFIDLDSDEERRLVPAAPNINTTTTPYSGFGLNSSFVKVVQPRPILQQRASTSLTSLPTPSIPASEYNMVREQLLSNEPTSLLTDRNQTEPANAGRGTTQPNTQTKPKKRKNSPRRKAMEPSGANQPEAAVAAKPKRKYTPRKPKQTQGQPSTLPVKQEDGKVSTEGSEAIPVKPKRKYNRKPKVTPQNQNIPATATAPVHDDGGSLPIQSTSSDSLPAQAQPSQSQQTEENRNQETQIPPAQIAGVKSQNSLSPTGGKVRGRKTRVPAKREEKTLFMLAEKIHLSYSCSESESEETIGNGERDGDEIEDDIKNSEEEPIHHEAIDEEVMIEGGDGHRTQGGDNNGDGENFGVLNSGLASIQNQDVGVKDSSEVDTDKALKPNQVISPSKCHPQTQAVDPDVGEAEVIEMDVENDDDCTNARSETGTPPPNLNNSAMSDAEVKPPATMQIEEDTLYSQIIDSLTSEIRTMTTNSNPQTSGENLVQEDDIKKEDKSDIEMEEEDRDPSSRPQSPSPASKRRARKLSSMDGDSDSVPYAVRLQEKKGSKGSGGGGIGNSRKSNKSSVTEAGSDNEEGTSRRTTRSRTAATSSSQPSSMTKENRNLQNDSASAKRRLTYGDETSDSDYEERAEDQESGSSDDESVGDKNGKPNGKSVTDAGQQIRAPVSRGSSNGRGRGRGRPFSHSTILNTSASMLKCATNIARKRTQGNVKSPELEDEEDAIAAMEDPRIMENVGNWIAQVENEKACGMNSGPSTQYQPQYTKEEKEKLYADQCFVIDVNDIGKAPENTFVWQIHDEGRYLRQYYPAKFAGRQFHTSTSVSWYFLEEDFKSEEFYKRFQPVVVIVASTKVCFPATKYSEEMVDQVIQYVYIDKGFFIRMTKTIGKIHELEYFREDFIESLPVYVMISLVPTFISKVTAFWDNAELKKFHLYMLSWKKVEDLCGNLFTLAMENTELCQPIMTHLMVFPDITYSWKNVNKKKHCSACEKSRTPIVTVITKMERSHPIPYNPVTLEELSPCPLQIPSEPIYLCKTCCIAAKKFHRFYHFRYSLCRLVQQNMDKDIQIFRRANAEITDSLLIWILRTERSWQNAMFLDFQVCAAEVIAEFGKKREPEAAASTSTAPTANDQSMIVE